MSIEFEISDMIQSSVEEIYEAWLNSEGHTKMTGGQAKVSPIVGETFEAWDGYIQGKNLELKYPKRILQEWRTTEFDETENDSRLEILFEAIGDETRVTIRHSDLPEHGMQYRQGWIDAYLNPMKEYFNAKAKTDK